MASKALPDPLYSKVLKQLSLDAQRHLSDTGLSDPGVLESYLGDPSTDLQELAFEPRDIPILEELLNQAHRAARGQRAEFARRGAHEFIRGDETGGPSELQRAIVAPPPWHCRRLPCRLARSLRLEGDSRAREKTEEE